MMSLFATVLGIDYIASPKLVNFQIGAKPGDRQNVSIAVPLTDNIVENTESFQLHLTSISSGAAVSNTSGSATVNIADQSCESCP